MGACEVCGASGRLIASALGVCGPCLAEGRGVARAFKAHRDARADLGLPAEAPREGVRCDRCLRGCRPAAGSTGFCGVRIATADGVEDLAGPGQAVVDWYYDPLPTNCVADWVCAEGSGRRPHGDGRKNLAVFFGGCSFHCAFCQNVSHWALARAGAPRHSVSQLASAVDGKTACLCYFGGDPTPQIAFSLEAAEEALRAHPHLRLCWETNGSMSPHFADRMLELSLKSGGCVKFDLKARTDSLHRALTSASNQLTLRNFARLAGRISERPDPPPLLASTLLVPGYVGPEEVAHLAEFLATQDPTIPYALLGFAPHYLLSDLPATPWGQAKACFEAACQAGLTRVRLGNLHLFT